MTQQDVQPEAQLPEPPSFLTLVPDEIDSIPWVPELGAEGVTERVLWRSGHNEVGLIRIEPGASKPAHTHWRAHHHIWIVDGACTMLGRALTSGSYAYSPPRVAHEVTDVGPQGCTFLYTYGRAEIPRSPLPGDEALASGVWAE